MGLTGGVSQGHGLLGVRCSRIQVTRQPLRLGQAGVQPGLFAARS